MTSGSTTTRTEALRLCRLASEGELDLSQLCETWPCPVPGSPLLALVRDDVEDAVEHFPSGGWSRKPLWDVWRRSHEFLTLVVDEVLLESELPDEVLIRKREVLLKVLRQRRYPLEAELRNLAKVSLTE